MSTEPIGGKETLIVRVYDEHGVILGEAPITTTWGLTFHETAIEWCAEPKDQELVIPLAAPTTVGAIRTSVPRLLHELFPGLTEIHLGTYSTPYPKDHRLIVNIPWPLVRLGA